jgi:hypothetical protein
LGSLDFLDMFGSKNSITMYLSHYRNYLRALGLLDKDAVPPLAELSRMFDSYFSSKRNYEEDYETFFKSMMNRPPTSVGVALSTLDTLLWENEKDKEVSTRFRKHIRRRIRGGPQTVDAIPTQKFHILPPLPCLWKAVRGQACEKRTGRR